jgi:hypothetical protein
VCGCGDGGSVSGMCATECAAVCSSSDPSQADSTCQGCYATNCVTEISACTADTP